MSLYCALVTFSATILIYILNNAAVSNVCKIMDNNNNERGSQLAAVIELGRAVSGNGGAIVASLMMKFI